MGAPAIEVKIYFTADGQLFQEIDGVKVQLNPWVGKEIEGVRDTPDYWFREDVTEYKSNDLMKYLKAKENAQ